MILILLLYWLKYRISLIFHFSIYFIWPPCICGLSAPHIWCQNYTIVLLFHPPPRYQLVVVFMKKSWSENRLFNKHWLTVSVLCRTIVLRLFRFSRQIAADVCDHLLIHRRSVVLVLFRYVPPADALFKFLPKWVLCPFVSCNPKVTSLVLSTAFCQPLGNTLSTIAFWLAFIEFCEHFC